jgi:exopolysaccharide production protein ExoZ
MSAVVAHLPIYLEGAFGLTVPPGGVDLFFVISGYIMVYTSTGVTISPRKFMARRIIRIVPLYWAMTLFIVGVAVVAPSLVHATSTNLEELFKSLFFIPFLKTNGEMHPALFVGWTLNFEMFFYLLFAATLFLRNELLRTVLVMLTLTAIMLWGMLAHPTDPVLKFLASPYLFNFVLGIAIGLATPYLPKTAPKGGLTGVLTIAAIGMACQLAGPVMFPHIGTPITCGLPSAVLIAALVVAERWGWRITSPTIILLGDATYAIYLTHPFVTAAMEKLTARLTLNVFENGICMIIAMAAAALVGILVHRYVETPLSNWARKVRLPGALPSGRPQPAPNAPASGAQIGETPASG